MVLTSLTAPSYYIYLHLALPQNQPYLSQYQEMISSQSLQYINILKKYVAILLTALQEPGLLFFFPYQ
jgi:hypothetical protein